MLSDLAVRGSFPVGTAQGNFRNNRGPVQRSDNSQHVNLVMFIIIAVFMVCHFVRIPAVFYHDYIDKWAGECSKIIMETRTACVWNLQMNETRSIEAYYPDWLKKTTSLGHLLVIVNSSVNFIIYCLVAPPFRTALARKCACLRRSREGTEALPQVEMIQMTNIRTLPTLADAQDRQGTEERSQLEMIATTNNGALCTLAAPLNGE